MIIPKIITYAASVCAKKHRIAFETFAEYTDYCMIMKFKKTETNLEQRKLSLTMSVSNSLALAQSGIPLIVKAFSCLVCFKLHEVSFNKARRDQEKLSIY